MRFTSFPALHDYSFFPGVYLHIFTPITGPLLKITDENDLLAMIRPVQQTCISGQGFIRNHNHMLKKPVCVLNSQWSLENME
jgi:hypothetical protein